nr:ulp1 protease family, C-terminal catalytic domain-containing protein [Tanacetum cinerariifolium]
EKAQEAPQNVKPKPAAVKTKEAAEKPKPAENVKEVTKKSKEPAEKAQEAPQYRIEFVLGNSLFAMEGDKYETVFKSLGGYRELSSVRVNMETLAPTLCIDANVIDC